MYVVVLVSVIPCFGVPKKVRLLENPAATYVLKCATWFLTRNLRKHLIIQERTKPSNYAVSRKTKSLQRVSSGRASSVKYCATRPPRPRAAS